MSLFTKAVFTINLLVALLLLLTCLAPFISVKDFPILTMLSLGTSLLFVFNILFVLYWAFRRKWIFVISLACLGVTFLIFGSFYKTDIFPRNFSDTDLTVMSYNVRGFNKEGELPNTTVFEDVKKLIYLEDPDVICIQEVDYQKQKEFPNYPYRHLKYILMKDKTIMAIFSKHPIVRAEQVNFPESHNNGSFADILYKNDTIRIYNLHFESLGINATTYNQKPSDNIYEKLETSFNKQIEQSQVFLEHSNDIDYKKIVCGDFNNTQFSKLYRSMKGNMQDTFLEEGSGFGRTYDLYGLPLRIDFIFADSAFDVTSHKNFDQKYSDHFPIVASFRLKED